MFLSSRAIINAPSSEEMIKSRNFVRTPSSVAQERISVVSLHGGIQNRTTTRNWMPAFNRVRNKLLELVDAIRNVLQTMRARLEC